MKELLMITFYGNMFLFDNHLNAIECESLQDLANSGLFKESIDINNYSETLSKYLDMVYQKFSITLDPVRISYIVRIT
jgi:hypothetical protein